MKNFKIKVLIMIIISFYFSFLYSAEYESNYLQLHFNVDPVYCNNTILGFSYSIFYNICGSSTNINLVDQHVIFFQTNKSKIEGPFDIIFSESKKFKYKFLINLIEQDEKELKLDSPLYENVSNFEFKNLRISVLSSGNEKDFLNVIEGGVFKINCSKIKDELIENSYDAYKTIGNITLARRFTKVMINPINIGSFMLGTVLDICLDCAVNSAYNSYNNNHQNECKAICKICGHGFKIDDSNLKYLTCPKCGIKAVFVE